MAFMIFTALTVERYVEWCHIDYSNNSDAEQQIFILMQMIDN